MKQVKKLFLKGLITVIPITATIAVLIWLVTFAEDVASRTLRYLFPNIAYWPGMGVVFALLFIFVVGAILNAWIAQKIFQWGESIVYKIPFIKTIYDSIKDLIVFFSSQERKDISSVVLVNIGEDKKVLGLVTCKEFQDEETLANKNVIAVYLPMSYQLGGYTVFIPKENVEEVDIPVDRALSQTLTGWIQSKNQ